jgi:hypothetical protein
MAEVLPSIDTSNLGRLESWDDGRYSGISVESDSFKFCTT